MPRSAGGVRRPAGREPGDALPEGRASSEASEVAARRRASKRPRCGGRAAAGSGRDSADSANAAGGGEVPERGAGEPAEVAEPFQERVEDRRRPVLVVRAGVR
ncbi:hypothetical protein SNE510_38480 [Streptomyces sp. NE5-10]|nr:hypothetical protein SNE510_38480 [Streptomyces sp. NE5-10]